MPKPAALQILYVLVRIHGRGYLVYLEECYSSATLMAIVIIRMLMIVDGQWWWWIMAIVVLEHEWTWGRHLFFVLLSWVFMYGALSVRHRPPAQRQGEDVSVTRAGMSWMILFHHTQRWSKSNQVQSMSCRFAYTSWYICLCTYVLYTDYSWFIQQK